jgi:cobaltochelatase CobN
VSKDRIKLVYFSVTSNEIPNLSAAILEFQSRVAPVAVFARTRTQLENAEQAQKEFITKALGADIIIVSLMSGSRSCPAWDALIHALDSLRKTGAPTPYFHVQPTGTNPESMDMVQQYSDGVDDGLWQTLNQYYRYGGVDNLRNMLICLHNRMGGTTPLAPPVRPPSEGIYHPDLDHVPDLKDYLKQLDPDKPTLGIWFYQNFWVTNNKDHIDAMVHEVERQGNNVLCVFHTRFKDKQINNHGADYVIDHFFMDKEKPIIDALINPVMFSLAMASKDYKHLLYRLGVPVIQAISTGQSITQWEESPQGLNNVDITIGVAQPELDGVIITVPVAAKQFTGTDPITGSAINRYLPIPERITKMVSLAGNWAKLRHKHNQNKKIAIIFHHYPPRNDRIGCASGLDSFESVKRLIDHMQQRGYTVDTPYATGDELAKALVRGMTCDQRFLLPEQMAERATATAGPDTYLPWHDALPKKIRTKMTEDWNQMPGDLFVHDNRLLFPGMVNGNLFITIQPPRGFLEQVDALYHDPHLSPPHHYLAQYRWIKEEFKADAVLHVGKHGSLEWLPGKAVGLGPECYPDLAIMDLPNTYIYIINDPGEGTQAKRRSFACIIDHLPPALANADLYDELVPVDNLAKEYLEAKVQDPSKTTLLKSMIWDAVKAADLDQDLAMDQTQAMADFDGFMEKLHHCLNEIADTAITQGLHILGSLPEHDRLAETIVQMTRLANGPVPSLRESIVTALGHDFESVMEHPHRGRIIEKAHAISLALITDALKAIQGSSPDFNTPIKNHLGKTDARVLEVLEYAMEDLLPRLLKTSEEITHCLDAFEGRFVPPGPSGAPSRGDASILPTGRNFYSVDPQKIPTPAAWEVGKRLGDALIDRYRKEHDNRYPESVGMILWASPTMRSKGDDIAEILYLMGVKPIWQKGSGNVRGLEVIPAHQLNRPRIDVSPRISGIFRDAFPLLTDLIDKGVQMVALLKEDPAANFIRSHVIKDMDDLAQKGMDQDEAFREATFRIFGSPAGSYGAGVAELIESKRWETTDDLGNMFIQWSSHAYGQNTFGKPCEKGFRRALNRMSVTVKNEDTREKDMMLCTDYYNYHGGLIAAVRTVQGSLPFSLAGDSSDPERVKMRTTAEEARHVFRSRLLNPKWIQGLKEHGYKGAGDLSKAMDIIIGWDATADVIDDAMYRRFAQKVPLDPKIQEWMQAVNPYALQNILDKLLEASARGLWQADDAIEKELKQAYLDVEGEIEEISED